MKHIFVTGGVVSGLGKGITAASLGRLLKARGYKVASQKLDPYINVDPGTMSPYQHGEVYVTEDGAETDLDLGHYERFIDEDLNRYSNLTTGKVYANVLRRERQGGYLGKTVQTIPHITDEIKRFIYRVGEHSDADIVITEIGGTIGDIESQPFLEAIRQVGREVGRNNALYIHVTLVPYLKASGEHKSKPTQHSVKELQGMGIFPDIIVLRTDEPITDETIFDKIANFCNVDRAAVIENLTLPVLYEAPLYLEQAHFSEIVCQKLDLPARDIDLSSWRAMVDRIHASHEEVTIALVGKYTQLHDAYLSIVEALHHAGYARGVLVRIRWIDSEAFVPTDLAGVDGVLVPGGFGSRGIDISASVLACRSCASNMLEMWWAGRTPTPGSSTRRAPTRSSTSCRARATRWTRAAPCASAAIPARSSPAPRSIGITPWILSRSGTGTGTSSTTNSDSNFWMPGSPSRAYLRTGGWWRPRSSPIGPSS